MKNKLTRKEIFALASSKLREEFDELRAVPHAGVKGMEAENLIKSFLNDHLPSRFKATSGFVIDHEDNVTGHNDVVIYDSINCPLYRASENAAIIPNDNVAAVVEVKSSLDKTRLEDAAIKLSEAKSLAKRKPARTTDQYNQPINYETLGFVFAYESPLTIDKLSEHYTNAVLEFGFPAHIDYIFVLDKAMFSLAFDPLKSGEWAPIVIYHLPPLEGTHVAVGAVDLGEGVLQAFISMLISHLQFFRQSMDHPGFNWGSEQTQNPTRLRYVTSITQETNPVKRAALLAQYKEEARDNMGGHND